MTREENDTISEVDTNTSELHQRPATLFGNKVEIPVFITALCISLTSAAVSNIVMYRTCVHALNHTKEECHMFLTFEKHNGTEALEKEVQQYATFVNTVKSIIESVAPAILTLFLGVWSDTHGRKPLIEWPTFGMCLTGMLMVVYTMLDDLGPWWYILTIVPFSLTGGYLVMFTGCFCYLNDVTTIEQRSLRMTLLDVIASIAMVVGGISSSYVLKAVGHVYLLLIAATLYVLEYVYINVCLMESLANTVQGGITTLLDTSLVKEMFLECFKWRPNNKRAQILLLTAANSLSILTFYGLINLEYLYTREKLDWNMMDYNWYSSINITITFMGSLIGIGIIQKFLGISDLNFSNISLISSGVEYVMKAFAVTTWHMYFAAGVSLFKGISGPLIRSSTTKILPASDVAKLFALMSAVECLCPLIAPLIYNTLYEFTLSTFPGTTYILSAGIIGVSVLLVGLAQYYGWKVSTPYQAVDTEA